MSQLYGDLFAAKTMSADLRTVSELVQGFFAKVHDKQWKNPTGKQRHDWTLHQTLAHVTAVAELINNSILAVVDGKAYTPGVTERSGLGAFNKREIAARQNTPPTVLIQNLLDALDQTAHRTETFSDDLLQNLFDVPVFHRQLPLGHMVGWQLVHIGIVHAAQLTRAVGLQPLWRDYSTELLHRQLVRVLWQASYAYWPAIGRDLRATVQLIVAGQGGGEWYLEVGPDGGKLTQGRAPKATATIWTQDPDILCGLLTENISQPKAFLRGQMFGYGNLWKVRRIPANLMATGF